MGAQESRQLGQSLLDWSNASRHGAPPGEEILPVLESVWQQLDCGFKESLLKRLRLIVTPDRFDGAVTVMVDSIVKESHHLWTVRPEAFFGDELSKPSLQEAAQCLDNQKGQAEYQQRFLHMAMAYVRGTHGYKIAESDKHRVYEGKRNAVLASKFTLGAPFIINIARSTLRKLPVEENNETHQKVMRQLEGQNALVVALPYRDTGLAVWNYLVNHRLVREAVDVDKEWQMMGSGDVWTKLSSQCPPPSQLPVSLQTPDQVAPSALPDDYTSFTTPQPTRPYFSPAQLFLPMASPSPAASLSLIQGSSTTVPQLLGLHVSLDSRAFESNASFGATEYLS
ncbi:hypothetical protein CSPX01_00095 [Colletotrichum filicis]|nr:hypothetical protein CSPX01_00095 [Colletotrichum filicis]